MRLKAKKGNFEDRTSNSKARVQNGYYDAVGRKLQEEAKYRQAKVAGENDSWVPLKYRNGYHRADYAVGKVVKRK